MQIIQVVMKENQSLLRGTIYDENGDQENRH